MLYKASTSVRHIGTRHNILPKIQCGSYYHTVSLSEPLVPLRIYARSHIEHCIAFGGNNIEHWHCCLSGVHECRDREWSCTVLLPRIFPGPESTHNRSAAFCCFPSAARTVRSRGPLVPGFYSQKKYCGCPLALRQPLLSQLLILPSRV